MDTLFFWASKLVWALISPDSLLVILLVSSAVLLHLKQHSLLHTLGRRILTLTCVLTVVVTFLPVGEWLIYPLERRFTANPELPARIDGIIVLGGALNAARSSAWGQTETDDAAERINAFVTLARRYPEARLVFSGGSGGLSTQNFKEADYLPALLQESGLGERALLVENQSRNTWENAVLSKALVQPQAQEHWVLITSAFHMPRSTGIFCQQQWPVLPWPVDHRTDRERLWRVELQFAEHLRELRNASREWVGLLAYYFSGKTDRLVPAESTHCAA
ncbi:MAG: YdcF family protein [Pseudomonadota bacterium]